MIGFRCCKDCVERVVGCHSTCKQYINAKETHNKNVREYRRANGTLFVSECDINPKKK